MHEDSRAQLAPWWLDRTAADQFVARQLRSSHGRDRRIWCWGLAQHRSAVVQRAPEALPVTFGLREFARLAALVDPDSLPAQPVPRAHALIDEVRLMRGLVAPDRAGRRRVPDPMGRRRRPPAGRGAHRDAVQEIVDVIAPPRAPLIVLIRAIVIIDEL